MVQLLFDNGDNFGVGDKFHFFVTNIVHQNSSGLNAITFDSCFLHMVYSMPGKQYALHYKDYSL